MKIQPIVLVFALGCGASPPVASPPPPADWRADLQCLADRQCTTRAPDCALASPSPVLERAQCGGTERPGPSPEESAEYTRRRARAIADHTWPCRCSCPEAERKHREECARIP